MITAPQFAATATVDWPEPVAVILPRSRVDRYDASASVDWPDTSGAESSVVRFASTAAVDWPTTGESNELRRFDATAEVRWPQVVGSGSTVPRFDAAFDVIWPVSVGEEVLEFRGTLWAAMPAPLVRLGIAPFGPV